MSSPAEIAADLADVSELLSAQVNAGLDHDNVLLSLFNSWAQRLSVVSRMAPKGKTLVTTAIQDGPWTPDQKKDLASIVLGNGQQSNAKAASRRPTQKLMNPENYIRMSTMIKLRDAKFSRASRMSVLAAELRNVGLENPDEKTLYKLVQLLAYCENNFEFTQDQVWSCMDDLQSFIKSVPRRKELRYLEHYPATAQLLPSEMKAEAYPDGEPVSVDIPELAGVLRSAKMRGRPQPKHAEKSPKWLSSVPAEMRPTVMAALQGATKPKTTPTTSDASKPELTAPALPSTGTEMNADVFRFQAPPAMKPAAPPATEPADPGDDDESEEANANTIDELEQSLLDARSGVRAKAMKKRD